MKNAVALFSVCVITAFGTITSTPAAGTQDVPVLRIKRGDLVQIRVAPDSSLNDTYSVSRYGEIEFGSFGLMDLSNLSIDEATHLIQVTLESNDVSHARVDVRIMRTGYDSVEVIGAVTRPGVVGIGAGETETLTNILMRVNGLQKSTRAHALYIARSGMTRKTVQVADMEKHVLEYEGDRPVLPSVRLSHGDILYLPQGDAHPLILGRPVPTEIHDQPERSASEGIPDIDFTHRSTWTPQQCERAYLAAIKADPENAVAHYNLGVLYQDDLGQPSKAVQHYTRYLHLRPNASDVDTVKKWIEKLETEILKRNRRFEARDPGQPITVPD